MMKNRFLFYCSESKNLSHRMDNIIQIIVDLKLKKTTIMTNNLRSYGFSILCKNHNNI